MKKISALLLALCLLFCLTACGSSSSQYAKSDGYNSVAPAEAPMAEDDYWSEAASAYGGLAMNEGEPPEPQADSVPAVDPEKIIYSASATVETTDFDDTLTRLQAMVNQYGGFIESSSVNGSNFYSQSRGYASSRSADYAIRVPSGRFQELMGSLSTLGNIPYTNTYTDNISARYYDVQARLTAYRTQETRLLEMMEKAETVSDLIVIEDRLSELRYEIESLQSTLNSWDRQVSYSSVSVTVNEVTVYTPEAKLTYGQQLALAARNGFQSAVDFCSGLLLWLLEALPMLIILALVVFVVVILIRRGAKRSKEKKLRQWQQMQAQRTQAAVESSSAQEQK
ncbi:MAG: DUF4349 domain-containing protein [Oscillospiraceae bacterium]|nr:DUF4349 domain-containing protein [Oscillospiraceae bacterium]